MPTNVRLDFEYLHGHRDEYVKAWQLNEEGLYLPPTDTASGLWIWLGEFAEADTIVMASTVQDERALHFGQFFVGIVEKEEIDASPNYLETAASAAVHTAFGLEEAVEVLNDLRGLPNREKMRFASQ